MRGWSDDRTLLLGELIDCGLTASQAAPRLGVSRNAAISRARRKGWRFGQPRGPDVAPVRRAPKRRLPPPALFTERVQIRLDGEMMQRIRDRAGTDTLTSTIRDLIEWGLEAGEVQ